MITIGARQVFDGGLWHASISISIYKRPSLCSTASVLPRVPSQEGLRGPGQIVDHKETSQLVLYLDLAPAGRTRASSFVTCQCRSSFGEEDLYIARR